MLPEQEIQEIFYELVGILQNISISVGMDMDESVVICNGRWIVQYCLDLRKILGVAKKFLKSRSFLFQTPQNP